MKARKWEAKMNEARALKRQGTELLFRRVVLLVECYNDPQFRKWCDDNNAVDLDFLDAEVSDLAANFMTLKAVLESYPTVESWQKHDLRDLIAEILAANKKPREGEKVSWKERCLAAERECERLRGELEVMQKAMEMSGVLSRA